MTDGRVESWDKFVGFFHDGAGVTRLLHVDAAKLEELVRERTVLRLVTSDGVDVYPAFQFSAGARTLPHLREVLDALSPTGNTRWGDALWLNAAEDDLCGLTPAEALRADLIDEVLRLAREAGAFRLP